MEQGGVLGKFAEAQVEKWKRVGEAGFAAEMGHLPVITVSIAAGSDGRMVARKTADALGFEYFDRELLEVVAKSAEVTPQVLENLERERFSGFQDFISSLLNEKYLWPGVYLEHLQNMVQVIGGRGRSVIVGRGANFILPWQTRLSIRVVAPMETRIENIIREFKVSETEAQKRIEHRDSTRASFVKKSFQFDIEDPAHYDVVINTGTLSLEAAVGVICSAWMDKFRI